MTATAIFSITRTFSSADEARSYAEAHGWTVQQDRYGTYWATSGTTNYRMIVRRYDTSFEWSDR